ncbi:MAG TPA: hypothetical protein PLW10_08135, partial [Myxococcota bacterium]|nr:hypothetical protein [Myxococcota bacterium]
QMGFLSLVEVSRQPMVSFGVRTGEELAFTGAPLAPERSYFYFFGDSALEAGYGPISFSTGGELLSVVLDPTDPYFYVGAEMSGLGGDDSDAERGGADAGDRRDGRGVGGDDSAAGGSQGGRAGNDGASDGSGGEGDAADAETEDESSEEEDDGVSIPGVAFSLHGYIPFEPLNDYGVEDEMPVFDGHLFVRGPIPLFQGLTLDGDTVIDIDPDEDGDHPFEPTFYDGSEFPDLALGGNGALSVGIPFLEFFEYGFELGTGTAAGRLGERDQRVVFSGELGLDQESFLGDLPIGIEAGGRVAVYGVFEDDLLASFIHAEGEMALDPTAIGRAFGVQLGPVASSEMVLDISALGLYAQGSTSVSPFPALGFAEAGAETFVSTNGLDSYFALRGAMALDGIGLENAEFKAHVRDGVTVRGAIFIGETEFAMAGDVGPQGYALEGSVALGEGVEMNAQETVALVDELLEHEDARKAIEDSLSVASVGLEAARWTAEAAWSAVEIAQIPVDELNGSIGFHDRNARANYDRYRSAKRRSCRWYQVGCALSRAWDITKYWSRHAYHVALAGSLRAALFVPEKALAAARNVAEQAESQLAAAKNGVDTLNERLDDIARLVADARRRLDALPAIEGEIVPIVTARIEDGRVSASVVGLHEGRVVTEGRVRLEAPAEACLDIPAQGEFCVRL